MSLKNFLLGEWVWEKFSGAPNKDGAPNIEYDQVKSVHIFDKHTADEMSLQQKKIITK